MRESYDAGQAWLVVTLVGMAIGLNSALLNIITEWLSDIKLGHCTTAFYLNEQFCCWGAEGGMLGNSIATTANSDRSRQAALSGNTGLASGCSIMSFTSFLL